MGTAVNGTGPKWERALVGTGKVRVDAVALTDAFEFPDNALNSAVGRHDGNVCVVGLRVP